MVISDRFGQKAKTFAFEAGRRSSTGEGFFKCDVVAALFDTQMLLLLLLLLLLLVVVLLFVVVVLLQKTLLISMK